jgi:hypothetical protein
MKALATVVIRIGINIKLSGRYVSFLLVRVCGCALFVKVSL